MKYVIMLLILTVTAQSYTEEQKRDLKYLKIEGRAARAAAEDYKKKLDAANKSLSYSLTKLSQAEKKLKDLQTKAKCASSTCKHTNKVRSCYKFKRSLSTLGADVKKYQEIVDKRKKAVEQNKKFMEAKSKLYKECLEKYKRIIGK
jgi:chromosome segregation ATPase